ncbi:hypothetical protein Pmar_PMAR008576 [Perkinsus marinus ATCC 50983]|uniref:Uncharacterized protein n=1 Tax=Perkinsus marinus (strain ATCC 50983 / TXsc) TaxID=423536 RepID=C5L5K0_PERM5|nr:hypothetical protein Pmar_PMAR008576 [Perkinsus marinus ATCC 50983]EER07992.1 hypothetical protein Pmar_PMAR008576 [Perkinsus marinus ATCC 50983]|eukprot:XP_002776176.1 hypothetical protein Pmar_PMAR008576 [Perkinsus marinus ATCC 50983]
MSDHNLDAGSRNAASGSRPGTGMSSSRLGSSATSSKLQRLAIYKAISLVLVEQLRTSDSDREANEWGDDVALKKLPTLLEKVALLSFSRIPYEKRKTLGTALSSLEKELAPEESTAFDDFSNATYSSAETLDYYAYRLTELLDNSGLSLEGDARDALLVAKFIASLPAGLQLDLRKARETIKNLQQALRMAKRLQAIQPDTKKKSVTPVTVSTSSTTAAPEVEPQQLPSVKIGEASDPDPAVAAIADLTEAIRQEQHWLVNYISRRGKGRGSYNWSRRGQRFGPRSMRSSRSYPSNGYYRPVCDYCGIAGHLWRQCRKRLRDEAERRGGNRFSGKGFRPDRRKQPSNYDDDIDMNINYIDTMGADLSGNGNGAGSDRMIQSHLQ